MKIFRSYNDLICSVVMEELVRLGIEDVFIAPGSRSTPLVFAAEENPKLRKNVHFDERGMAFCALGCAKKSRRPVVLITTSGSAAANLYPAIIEAQLTEVPLLIFTADRPFELRGTGANQAIDQVNMFNHILEFHDMPVPSPYLPVESVLTTIDHCVRRAASLSGGPVHLNWMFQEPLAPPLNEVIDYKPSAKIAKWFSGERPFTDEISAQTANVIPSEVKKQLLEAKNGLVIVGAQGDVGLGAENFKNLPWPVFFDIQSSLRLQTEVSGINHWDLLLELKRDYRPDCVILLGGAVTNRKGLEFVKELGCPVIQVHPFEKKMDPHHLAKVKLTGTGDGILSCLAEASRARDLDTLVKIDKLIGKTLENQFRDQLSEPSVAFQIAKRFSGANLFLASSRPIRDFQRYASSMQVGQSIFSNRGASGIDGNLATVAGLALASKSEELTVALLGDLATLHDLNSLALISKSKNPILLVVINNDGGGIFSFLPVAQHKNVFEKYWGTPHGVGFENFAKGFNLPYKKIESISDFTTALDAFKGSGHLMIEIKSNRQNNFDVHQKILEEIKAQVIL